MTLGISRHRWRFLAPNKANAYVEHYERLRMAEEKEKKGWKRLVPATMQRQFATARAILDRLHEGKQGVLLADDVGLGKTTVAALCALVFAGSDKRVRILAPNDMMTRRWRQELEIHIEAVASFAPHLDLENARKRLGQNIRKLHSGAIAVSTHTKATRLACDLLIIDEAHRTRSDHSVMARQVRRQRDTIARVLVLTATPFSIDPSELARLLVRIGGESAEQPMKHYAKKLDDLWRGRNAGSPAEIASELVDAARAAVDAMKPYVIRHSINDLSRAERRTFGDVCDEGTAEPPMVPDDLLEAMLRTDRALELGRRCNAWDMKRRNDPRYHVAAGKLESDLTDLLETVARCDGDDAALASHHARLARKHVRSYVKHPKIADTVETTRAIVEQGEKVLIFCDHHLPAEELTKALADELRWPAVADDGIGPGKDEWEAAWWDVFSQIREAVSKGRRVKEVKRLENYLEWLLSDGISAQIKSWLGAELRPGIRQSNLRRLLEKRPARGHAACDAIAAHAQQLYEQLVESKSKSTRAILLRDDEMRLPGSASARVAAACDVVTESLSPRYRGVFYPREPDATLAVFNSPFGPDVLVATDRLSEGVDMHRFCRHLIHHELDPSPVRTVQRNGRLRRVDSWAARTRKNIRILYPALRGTRDEKLVEIMQYRLAQFDLLLGGVRTEVTLAEADVAPTNTAEILEHARRRLGRIRLGIE